MIKHTKANHFFLLVLILTCKISVFGQVNYLPATIIDNKNATINGFIDFREWVTNPATIDFKKTETGEVNQYTPQDIIYFTVAGEHFISKIFTLDETPAKDRDAPLGIAQILVTDTIFLKTLVYSENGLGLYLYRDNNDKNHFIIEKNKNFTELLLVKYLNRESNLMVNIYVFHDQLISATENCPALASQIKKTDYKLSDLVEIVSSYNACSEYTESYTYPISKNKKLFGILAGPTASKITYASNSTFNKDNYNFGIGIGSGFFLDIDLPGKRQTMWLNTELYINKFSTTGITDDTSSFFYEHTSIQFNILDLNALLAFKLQTNSPHIKPYFNLGVAATYSLINDNEKIVDKENKYTQEITTKIYLNEIEKSNLHFTYIAGAGVSLNNTYFLEFRYGRAFSISDTNGYQDDFSLFLRYAF